MKLIYLKLKEYKCLRNVEIYFSSSYTIINGNEFKESSSIKLNSYGVFNNITAFVGENGAGKSTLLEAISLLCSGHGDLIEGSLIVEVQGRLFSLGESVLLTFNGIKIGSLPPTYFAQSKTGLSVYYSPIYSPHTESAQRESRNFLNVSNDQVYKHSKLRNREVDLSLQFDFFGNMSAFAEKNLKFEKVLEIRLASIDYSAFYRKLDKLIALGLARRNKDVQDLINEFVVRNDLSPHSGFSLPLIENLDESDFEESDSEETYRHHEFSKNLRARITGIENRIKELINDFPLTLQVKVYFLLNFIISTLNVNNNFFRKIELENNLKLMTHFLALSHEEDLESWADDLSRQLNYLNLRKSSKFERWDADMRKLVELLSNYSQRSFPIIFPTDESALALKTISKLRKEGLLKYGLEINWRGISSGQVAKINLFSRLFSAIKNINEGNVLIILDEADIYLHPEWQRKFLYEISEFLSEVKENHIEGDVSFNLILTTHSPLMVSDLLKEDVYIIVKSMGEGSSLFQAQNETLGANIHQLYREEFVMTYPRGELADIFIKDLFNKIKDGSADPSFVRFAASKIGEVILSTGMLNALEKHDKFKSR